MTDERQINVEARPRLNATCEWFQLMHTSRRRVICSLQSVRSIKVRSRHLVIAFVVLPLNLTAQNNQPPVNVLPAGATAELERSLQADTRPCATCLARPAGENADGTVNASIENLAWRPPQVGACHGRNARPRASEAIDQRFQAR